jgi:hypothetical protein
MALTAEQQSQVDMHAAMAAISTESDATRRAADLESALAIQTAQAAAAAAADTRRAEAAAAQHTNQIEIVTKQAKLDAVRLAKEVLIENARSKPVGERDVTASDIIALANQLAAAINS